MRAADVVLRASGEISNPPQEEKQRTYEPPRKDLEVVISFDVLLFENAYQME